MPPKKKAANPPAAKGGKDAPKKKSKEAPVASGSGSGSGASSDAPVGICICLNRITMLRIYIQTKLKAANAVNVRHILCEKHSKAMEAMEKLQVG